MLKYVGQMEIQSTKYTNLNISVTEYNDVHHTILEQQWTNMIGVTMETHLSTYASKLIIKTYSSNPHDLVSIYLTCTKEIEEGEKFESFENSRIKGDLSFKAFR